MYTRNFKLFPLTVYPVAMTKAQYYFMRTNIHSTVDILIRFLAKLVHEFTFIRSLSVPNFKVIDMHLLFHNDFCKVCENRPFRKYEKKIET